VLAVLASSTTASPILEAVPPPDLGPADVRIRVAAAAANPVDVLMGRRGRARRGRPARPGRPRLGRQRHGHRGRRPGRRPAAGRSGGGDPSRDRPDAAGRHPRRRDGAASGAVARVPDGLDLVEAASLPLTRSPRARPSTCSVRPRAAPCWSPAAPAPWEDMPLRRPPATAGGSPPWPGTPTRRSSPAPAPSW